jgi:hypothetical protein
MTPAERLAALARLETEDFGKIPTKDLERGWLLATCLYEKWDKSGLSDGRWDALTAHMWKFKGRLSPYFCRYVPMACLQSSTGSGLDWNEGIPALVMESCKEIVDAGLL